MAYPRIYLSARSARREEMLLAAAQVEQAGLEVVSTWITEEPLDLIDSSAAADAATHDLADLSQAAVFVCFSEDQNATAIGRGGRHVELGYALARGIPIVLVGNPEHVFHRHPSVRRFPDWDAALNYVLALVETSAAPREDA